MKIGDKVQAKCKDSIFIGKIIQIIDNFIYVLPFRARSRVLEFDVNKWDISILNK
jgi:hypothetical protein